MYFRQVFHVGRTVPRPIDDRGNIPDPCTKLDGLLFCGTHMDTVAATFHHNPRLIGEERDQQIRIVSIEDARDGAVRQRAVADRQGSPVVAIEFFGDLN